MTVTFDHGKEQWLTAAVMVVDDQPTSRVIIEAIVRGIGNNVDARGFGSAAAALDAIGTGFIPDLVIADYRMPGMNGVELTRRIRRHADCHDVPIVMITVVDDKAVMYNALEAGATDFLLKPVDHYECKVRCRNLLTLRRQQVIIRNRASSLERRVLGAVADSRALEEDVLARLARIGEYGKHGSGRQPCRIGELAAGIAAGLGLPASLCRRIRLAAPLHDIGNTGLPDRILLKPGSLTAAEREAMHDHTQIGYRLLCDSASPYLQVGAVIALTHHERFDGRGYPDGLAGDRIPIEGRIAAAADVFDALRNPRPYRPPWTLADTLAEIRRLRGSHLDPDCTDALLACMAAAPAARVAAQADSTSALVGLDTGGRE